MDSRGHQMGKPDSLQRAGYSEVIGSGMSIRRVALRADRLIGGVPQLDGSSHALRAAPLPLTTASLT